MLEFVATFTEDERMSLFLHVLGGAFLFGGATLELRSVHHPYLAFYRECDETGDEDMACIMATAAGVCILGALLGAVTGATGLSMLIFV